MKLKYIRIKFMLYVICYMLPLKINFWIIKLLYGKYIITNYDLIAHNQNYYSRIANLNKIRIFQ